MMKIKSVEFELSAPDLAACPRWPLFEFALIGRSNVGKSSLLNMLMERRELAKVSDTPGKTQLLNFFVVNRNWSLVDLPGYGYARLMEHKRVAFNESVADFLEKRRNLAAVFVLIDSRLPPQAIDLEFLRWLEGCDRAFALVFTKVDKQSASQAQVSVDRFMREAGPWRGEAPKIFLSSAKTKLGRTEMLGFIEQALAKKAAPAA